MKTDMEEHNHEKRSIERDGERVYYFIDMRFPGCPVVVLLHGLSANHSTWSSAVRLLARNRINSLAVDLRGHGLSDKHKKKRLYRIREFSRDLEAIIKKEAIESPVLVGYSFGGTIAIDYAEWRGGGLSGVILVSTSFTNFFERFGLKFLAPAAYALADLFAHLLLWQRRKKYLYFQSKKVNGYFNSVWQGFKTMPLSVNLWLLIEAARADSREAVKKLSVPILLVYGKNDPFVMEKEIREVAGSMPKAELVIADFPNHFIASESDSKLNVLILDFIRKYAHSRL